LIVHADDLQSHTARIFLTILYENGVTKARPFPYSPDLAPSGFFLFGQAKQLLRGAECPDWNSLFDAIVQLLTGLEKGTLNDIVLSWMDRLRSCAAAHGDYIG
jgi:hypothetical protein